MTQLDLILGLIQIGFTWLRNFINLKETVIDSRDVVELLRTSLNIDASLIEISDRQYFTTTIETWKKIIAIDWVKLRKYVTERFDCDKFSRVFIGHIIEIYGLNSVGEARGVTINATTGEFVGDHSFIIFIDSLKNIYLQEPQTGEILFFEKGEPLQIGNLLYGFRKINI